MDLVGRKLPIRAGGAVVDLLDEMDATDGGPALADAVAALREATDWLLANGLADPTNALAGASPYLRMFGIAVGGWLLARSAAAPGADADKQAVAAFYATQLLPAARGLLPAVTAGPGSLFAIPEDRL
jgi:hypothetical protein